MRVVLAAAILLLLAAFVGILLFLPKPEVERPTTTTLLTTTTLPPEVEVKVEEILSRMKEMMEGVETYSFRMRVVVAPSEFVTEGQVDRKNKKAKLKLSGLMGEIEIYVIGNVAYTRLMGQWFKEEQPEAFKQLEWFIPETAEVVGEDVVDGHECYVLKYGPEYAKKVAQPTRGVSGLEKFVVEEVRGWVDKRTFHERKSELVGWAVVGGRNVSLVTTTVFWGFNEPVEIELPPEAEKAELFPTTSPIPLV